MTGLSVQLPYVYLAGPISGVSYAKATEWRTFAAGLLDPIPTLSPLRAKTYLDGERSIQPRYTHHTLSTGKGIYTRDRWDATRCGVLLVFLVGAQKVSVGTVMEIAWAAQADVPIVLVMEDWNVHSHPMLEEAAGFIVPTIDEACVIVRALILPDEYHR